MGLYDYVDYPPQPCWRCGHLVGGVEQGDGVRPTWQSKGGPCRLETIQPIEALYFYTDCGNCHAWNEYRLRIIAYEVEFDRVASERTTKWAEAPSSVAGDDVEG